MSHDESVRRGTMSRTGQDGHALLEVADLHAAYGREVLQQVDLTVVAGRCLVVIGESGAGKSTLLRALLGVGVSARGSVRLGGTELLNLAGRGDAAAARLRPAGRGAGAGRVGGGVGQAGARRAGRSGTSRNGRPGRVRGARIGMVFQDPAASFSPVQRVGQQVLVVARTHRRQPADVLRRQAQWLMSEVGLPGSAWRAYPGELSGGMAARMALVCALLPGPELLLMDEPTAGVDAATRQAVIDVVRRACAGTLTWPESGASAGAGVGSSGAGGVQPVAGPGRLGAVVVTHDLDLATALADDVLVLHAGRVVEYGPAAQVLTAPREEHTARLLEAFAQMRDGLEDVDSDARRPVGVPREVRQAQDRPAHRDAGRDQAEASGGVGRDGQAQDGTASDRAGASGGVVLAVRDLSKDWGEGPVLEAVSLTVRAGEAVALTGPSGVGKTTLARIVAGLAAPDGGSVNRPQEPGGVGLIFQSPAGQFNPRRRLWKSVTEGVPADSRAAVGSGGVLRRRRARREAARAAVAEVFVRCRLDPALMDAYPRQASLGQLQRAAIARAVLSGARLLICDEVTSALDPLATREVLDLLAELRDSGLAIVFITHERAAADYLCDREISLAGAS